MAAFKTKMFLLAAIQVGLIIGKGEYKFSFDFYSQKYSVDIYNYEDVCQDSKIKDVEEYTQANFYKNFKDNFTIRDDDLTAPQMHLLFNKHKSYIEEYVNTLRQQAKFFEDQNIVFNKKLFFKARLYTLGNYIAQEVGLSQYQSDIFGKQVDNSYGQVSDQVYEHFEGYYRDQLQYQISQDTLPNYFITEALQYMDSNQLDGIKQFVVKNDKGVQIDPQVYDVPFYNVEICDIYKLIPQIIKLGIFEVSNGEHNYLKFSKKLQNFIQATVSNFIDIKDVKCPNKQEEETIKNIITFLVSNLPEDPISLFKNEPLEELKYLDEDKFYDNAEKASMYHPIGLWERDRFLSLLPKRLKEFQFEQLVPAIHHLDYDYCQRHLIEIGQVGELIKSKNLFPQHLKNSEMNSDIETQYITEVTKVLYKIYSKARFDNLTDGLKCLDSEKDKKELFDVIKEQYLMLMDGEPDKEEDFPLDKEELQKNFAQVRILLKFLIGEPDNDSVIEDILNFPEIELNDIIDFIPDEKDKDLKDIHEKITKKVFNNKLDKQFDDVFKSFDKIEPLKNIDTNKDEEPIDFDFDPTSSIDDIKKIYPEEVEKNIEKNIDELRKKIDDIKMPPGKQDDAKEHKEDLIRHLAKYIYYKIESAPTPQAKDNMVDILIKITKKYVLEDFNPKTDLYTKPVFYAKLIQLLANDIRRKLKYYYSHIRGLDTLMINRYFVKSTTSTLLEDFSFSDDEKSQMNNLMFFDMYMLDQAIVASEYDDEITNETYETNSKREANRKIFMKQLSPKLFKKLYAEELGNEAYEEYQLQMNKQILPGYNNQKKDKLGKNIAQMNHVSKDENAELFNSKISDFQLIRIFPQLMFQAKLIQIYEIYEDVDTKAIKGEKNSEHNTDSALLGKIFFNIHTIVLKYRTIMLHTESHGSSPMSEIQDIIEECMKEKYDNLNGKKSEDQQILAYCTLNYNDYEEMSLYMRFIHFAHRDEDYMGSFEYTNIEKKKIAANTASFHHLINHSNKYVNKFTQGCRELAQSEMQKQYIILDQLCSENYLITEFQSELLSVDNAKNVDSKVEANIKSQKHTKLAYYNALEYFSYHKSILFTKIFDRFYVHHDIQKHLANEFLKQMQISETDITTWMADWVRLKVSITDPHYENLKQAIQQLVPQNGAIEEKVKNFFKITTQIRYKDFSPVIDQNNIRTLFMFMYFGHTKVRVEKILNMMKGEQGWVLLLLELNKNQFLKEKNYLMFENKSPQQMNKDTILSMLSKIIEQETQNDEESSDESVDDYFNQHFQNRMGAKKNVPANNSSEDEPEVEYQKEDHFINQPRRKDSIEIHNDELEVYDIGEFSAIKESMGTPYKIGEIKEGEKRYKVMEKVIEIDTQMTEEEAKKINLGEYVNREDVKEFFQQYENNGNTLELVSQNVSYEIKPEKKDSSLNLI